MSSNQKQETHVTTWTSVSEPGLWRPLVWLISSMFCVSEVVTEVGGHRLLACIVPLRKHYMTIPSCFFHGRSHWLSWPITYMVGLNKALTFTSLGKGNKEIEELRFLFCPEQSGHGDSASGNILSSQESEVKVNHELCNYHSVIDCIRTMVGFFLGFPPYSLTVHVAL